MNAPVVDFWAAMEEAVATGVFVKLTLSKPGRQQKELQRIQCRPVLIRQQLHLSATLQFERRDETRNFLPAEGIRQAAAWLEELFTEANLFTTRHHWVLSLNKRGEGRLQQRPAVHSEPTTLAHNHSKKHTLDTQAGGHYLMSLGIMGAEGQILQKSQRKYRQIQKYIEIISHLLADHPLPPCPRIADMGSGKGYLSFALYDFLQRQLGLRPSMEGVEIRPDLVDFCNELSRASGFDGLSFIAGSIEHYSAPVLDMLIALHACDTATDLALAKGIQAGAKLIVVAPCCHKQLRRDMKPPEVLMPMLRQGIFMERQAELLTDSLRVLLLEAHGYAVKTTEFVGPEDTPKNVLIMAAKASPNPRATEQISRLKELFGVRRHALEDLLAASGDS